MPAPIARESAAGAGRKDGGEAEHQRYRLSQVTHQKLTCRLSKATL
jgi:hypothetical protein